MQFPEIKDGKVRVQIWDDYYAGWQWADTPHSPVGDMWVKWLKESIWIPVEQYERWLTANELAAQVQDEITKIKAAT